MARRMVNPGPIDTAVLTMQPGHRSRSIWTDANVANNSHIKSCRYEGNLAPPRDHRMIQNLRISGFYGVALIDRVRLDHSLVCALVERWRPEVHTFHLPLGEVGITLQDVEVLFGLKVDGLAVTGVLQRTRQQWQIMCEQLLRFIPPDTAFKGQRISMMLIPDIPELTDASTDDDVAFATRAYLIRVLGGFLFPDTSNSLLNLYLLPFLEDFEECGQYSWGSAVLAFLYRALCSASEHDRTHVCGCLLLLQIWAWERLPMVRPQGFLPAHNGDDLPLASRWGGPHAWATVPNHVVRAYRDQLDRVNADSFVFQPYRIVLHQLPNYCRDGEDIWTAEVPLIFGYVVENYYPSRFCRQFGALQNIPPPVHYNQQLHAIDGRTSNAAQILAPHVDRWNHRHEYVFAMFVMDNPNATREYRLWFHTHGRRLIGNPEHRQDEGYIQTAASLNDTMHFLSQMNLGMEEAGDDPQRQSEWWREYRVALPAYVDQAGYGFLLDFPNEMYNAQPVDAPVEAGRRDRRRERDHLRGQPQRGGRRRRVRVDEGMDAPAPGMQHPAAADNVVGGDVDALALTIVTGQNDGSAAFQGAYTSFDQTTQFPHQTHASF